MCKKPGAGSILLMNISLMKSNSFEGHKTTEFKAILYNAELSSEKLKQLEMGSAGSEMKRESNFGAGQWFGKQ